MAVDSPSNAAAPNDGALEQALADFFDWFDQWRNLQDTHNTTSRGAREILELFFERHPAWHNSQIKTQLQECLCEILPVEQAAADLTIKWLDLESEHQTHSLPEPVETLPRPFAGYELLERVGQGGMGVVYKARQPQLGRIVCLKMLPPGTLDPDRVRRLTEEARMAGALLHPSIVAVFDAGESDGSPFYVMQFVPGETLAQRLARATLNARDTAKLLDEIAAAVQHAHEHSVLHRDLKPANVLLDADGRPHITDFGLARRLDVKASASGIAGTPAYMAPEQVRAASADERTDVYGLGTILYEILTGRPPHVADSPWETLRLVESAEPASPRQLRPGLSRDLETICLKCLQKSPAARYGSVLELRVDLQRYLRNEPISARPIGPVGRIVRWARRRPALAFSALITVVALLLVAVFGAIAFIQTREALAVTKKSEQSQRSLAGKLDREYKRAEESLYRSRTANIAQALEANNIVTARHLLGLIKRDPTRTPTKYFELGWLTTRAWPEWKNLGDESDETIDAIWLPDSEKFASITDDQLMVWNTNGVLLQKSAHSRPPVAVAASPKLIATADADGTIQLWSSDSLALHGSLPSTGVGVQQLIFISDQLLLMVDNQGAMRLTDTHERLWYDVPLQNGRPTIVRHSPDRQWLAIAWDDGRIELHDQRSFEHLATSHTGAGANRSASQSLVPRATMTTVSWIVDLAWCAAAPRLAAADEDGNIIIWDLLDDETGKKMLQERWKSPNANGPIATLAWQDESLFVAGERGGLVAFDAKRLRLSWSQPTLPIKRLIVGPQKDPWISIDRSGRAALWCLSTLSAGQPIWLQPAPIRTVATNRRGNYVAWRDVDGVIVVHDVDQRRNVLRLEESVLGATALNWHPQRDVLAVSRDNDVVMYEVAGGKQFARTNCDGVAWSLAFSPDGRHLAIGGAGFLKLVDLHNDNSESIFAGPIGDVRTVAFSPDSQLLAAVDGESQLRIWDLSSGNCLVDQRLQTGAVHALCFVEQRLLLASDNSGRILRIVIPGNASAKADRFAVTSWDAHRGPIWCLAAAGDRVISGGQDGRLLVWDSDGELLASLAQQQPAIWGVAWNGASGRLFVSTTEGGVHVWRGR